MALLPRIACLAALALAAVPAAAVPPNGAAIFAQNCSACHQAHGEGVAGAFPKLAGNAFVQGPAPGVAATVVKGRGAMPSFTGVLADDQIAAVLSYVRSSWGNHAPAIAPAVVAAAHTAR